MNVRSAILQAADHLERHPDCYDFSNGSKPRGPGGRACPLAWVGYFLGVSATGFSLPPLYANKVEEVLVGEYTNLATFFARCHDLRAGEISDDAEAPGVLRAYAERYHPLVALQHAA